MWAIVTDVVTYSLCVYLLGTPVSPTRTAKPIEMLFGSTTNMGQRNHVSNMGALAPLGEYNKMISAAAAMQAVPFATITIATCYSKLYQSDIR